MKKSYLAVLVVVLIICFAIFFYQLDHNVETFIVFNSTEIPENGSVEGHLIDAFSRGVPNKTITFHKPGAQMGTLVDVVTDENGTFVIENLQYLPEYGEDNYYGDFVFAGDDKFKSTEYGYNLTVTPK